MLDIRRFKKLIFLDSRSAAEGYLKENSLSAGIDKQDELLIAMNPSVRAYLKEKGIKAESTAAYFTNESHKKILEKSEILVEWLRKKAAFIDMGLGVQYAYREAFVFWARFVINYCLFEIEILVNAIQWHRPKIILASSSPKKFASSLQIEPEEKYLGFIAAKAAEQNEIIYKDLLKAKINNLSLFFSWLFNFAYSAAKYIFHYGNSQLFGVAIRDNGHRNKERKGEVIFTSKSYSLGELKERFKKECPDAGLCFLRKPPLLFFAIPDLILKLLCGRYSKQAIAQKRILKNIEIAIKQEAGLFSYKGIVFSDIVSEKIKNNIANYILGQIAWTIKLNKFIGKKKPSAVLSNGSRHDDLIWSELCQGKNIPTILISHGSHVRPKNIYEEIEWGEHGRALLRAPYSLLALQSPSAEGYLDVFPARGRAVKTGPLIWGNPVRLDNGKALFEKLFRGKYDYGKSKVILHAGTPKLSKGLRFYVYETPDEYIEALCELADAVREIPDALLIIKFRPSAEIKVSDLKSLVPFSEKVALSVDEPFREVLGISDLLVSFSSTTIEEALQNRINVLLYGGKGRYQHIPAYEINSTDTIQPAALYHVKEAKYVALAIKNILELKINCAYKEKDLFSPFIYAQDTRKPLGALLRELAV